MALFSRSRLVIAMAFLAGTSLPTCLSFPWRDEDDDNIYEPPQEGQVRSPCPAINTVANHGYIDRSGKNIAFKDLAQALDDVWGVPAVLIMPIAPFIPLLGIENEITKDGLTIDLDALFKHGAFEHDASLVREDFYFAGNSEPSQELFDQCIAIASPLMKQNSLTVYDIAACNRERILDTRRNNPTAYEGLININLGGLIGAGEAAAAMLFGDSKTLSQASKDDLESVLMFNRIPDGYRRREPVELVALLYPLSVTLPSAALALLKPVKKADGSFSTPSPEIVDNLISTLKQLKTLVAGFSSEIPESFVAVAEGLIADLENVVSSQNLDAHM